MRTGKGVLLAAVALSATLMAHLLPWLWAMCLMKMGVKRMVDRDTLPALRWCE